MMNFDQICVLVCFASLRKMSIQNLNVFFPKDSYLGVLMIFLQVQQVANLRRLGCAGAVVLRPAELCTGNIHPGAPIRPANQTSESNAPKSGSNFIYTKIAGRAAIGLYLHKDRSRFRRGRGGDLHENGDFQRVKMIFFDECMGAIFMKMAVFK